MFEWLFNYPINVWQSSTFLFASGWSMLWLVALIVAVTLLFTGVIWRRTLRVSRKISIVGLQCIAATALLLMLWQPVLNVQVSAPGENTVAWVLDSSASMAIADMPAESAAAVDKQSRLAAGSELISALVSENESAFDASLHRLGSELTRVEQPQDLQAQPLSERTRIADGLDALLSTVGESALAAVVLVSDGSDNSEAADAQWWQTIAAAGVPVHTLGMGQVMIPGDLQLSHVSMPESAPPDTRVTARLSVSHSEGGYARVRVLAGSELIAAQDIELPDASHQSVHLIDFSSGDNGVRQLTFEVRPSVRFDATDKSTDNADDNAAGNASANSLDIRVDNSVVNRAFNSGNRSLADPDLSNNRQPRVLRVSDTPKRILYVEGEPRWEFKFLRRALNDQAGVEVVSLLRTSPNKFYRQGVKDAGELANGFPQSRAELFAYDAVIIGSFEAVELSTEQQLALRDFVSVRGGSLLMLGGRHGLADGGWGRSVVAPALPVVLSSRLNAKTFDRERVQAVPTVSGYRTPWLQLRDSAQANVVAWQQLPLLADRQVLGAVKPGAVILLEQHVANDPSLREPLLVSQRYGRGQSLVLGTSGTWRWQMGLPSQDLRHEQFWQQLSGMLVDAVLPRMSVETTSDVYRDTQSVGITISAFNPDYTPLGQAQLPVQITLPDGSVQSLSLDADTQVPGAFTGSIDTELDGPYALSAMTSLGGESPLAAPLSLEKWWVHESGTAESFNASQQVNFLQRVADATGGQYLSFEDSEQLQDVLASNNVALKRDRQLPLWNMPILFILVFLAKFSEWILRMRWKRL